MNSAETGSNVPELSATDEWRPARLIAAVALGLFVLLAAAVFFYGMPYFAWDLEISHAVQAIPGAPFEYAMRGVSLAGDHFLPAALIVVAACLVLAVRRAWRELGLLLGVVVLGQLLKVGVKNFIARPRPSPDLVRVLINAQEVYSFPSGHTTHYVCFFGCLWFLTFMWVQSRMLRWPLLSFFGAMVLLVGLARVYLGAHWVTDVIGGYLLGAAVLAAGIGYYCSGCRQGSENPGG